MRRTDGTEEAALDLALSLYRAGRYGEARVSLRAMLARNPAQVTAWNMLGYLEGDVGEAAAAAAAFDRALDLEPADSIALKGRARVSLERSEPDTVARYDLALRTAPGDPQLILEQTEARIALGEVDAIRDFGRFVTALPQWTDGQVALARMLWESRRDEGFADHIRRLLAVQPRRLDLWLGLIDLLSSNDLHKMAADAARDARRAVGGNLELALREAVEAGWVGDVDRTEAVLKLLPERFPGRAIHDSVHLIRKGELEAACAAIDAAVAEQPQDMAAWAIAELVYRALGDPRSRWLSGQEGLVRTFDLALDPGRVEAIRQFLLALHRHGVQMIGQSVRAGTQTRWRLFDRAEPELAELKEALERAIAAYVADLPPGDESHPLLRHRSAPLTITGSWSVRLAGGGRHVSHVHPRGLISSACYFIVPGSGDAQEGSLELGRAPGNLLPDLAPLHVIAPTPGQLTLFPSFLHHGTRPFTAGERLAVAFDMNRHPAPPAM